MHPVRAMLSNLAASLYAIDNAELRRHLRRAISWADGGQAFSRNLRRVVKRYHNFEIGIGTYGACFNPDQVWAGAGLKIGKYCSFASGVCIYTRNHPLWFVSTCPLFYNPSFGALENEAVEYGLLEIGNDVWIGQNALIMPSCKTIGNGAVIGGCSYGFVKRKSRDFEECMN